MKFLFLKLIRFYQGIVSPLLHCMIPNSGCRFYPTCSDYIYRAIKRYGLLKGSFKGLKRLLKCHPFNGGGYDSI